MLFRLCGSLKLYAARQTWFVHSFRRSPTMAHSPYVLFVHDGSLIAPADLLRWFTPSWRCSDTMARSHKLLFRLYGSLNQYAVPMIRFTHK